MSKTNNELDPQPKPEIKPINYKALEYLGWFASDGQNLQQWASQLFGSPVDLNEPLVEEHKAAIKSAIAEIEDDIAKIKDFVKEYVPINRGE